MRFICIALTTACLGWSQSGSQFEAATVKPATGDRTWLVGGPGTPDPGRISYENIDLRRLLMLAYAVDRDQVSGPGWIDSERYTIVARIPSGATEQQFQIMLRNLVIDRFRLALHRDTREFSGYELVIAKGGPKLSPAELGDAGHAAERKAPDSDGCPEPRPGVHFKEDRFPRVGIGCARFNKYSVSQLAGALSVYIAAEEGGVFGSTIIHVIDKTALQGQYDFTLKFHFAPRLPGQSGLDDDGGPTVFAAIEQQLGLKLQKAREPLEVIVIDHVERTPIDN
jgi:uncharacterized protein (TIGR03435 family)